MISARDPHPSLLPPSPPPLPPAPPHSRQLGVAVLHHLGLAPLWGNSRDMGEYFRDVPHSFGATLSEHHPRSRSKVLRVLDESEEAGCFVPRA